MLILYLIESYIFDLNEKENIIKFLTDSKVVKENKNWFYLDFFNFFLNSVETSSKSFYLYFPLLLSSSFGCLGMYYFGSTIFTLVYGFVVH